MTTSLELLKQITNYNEAHLEPQYTAPEEMYVALAARVVNEAEVTKQLANALALMPCSCTREYPYHGKGVKMCVRCRSLVLWETLQTGRSETQAKFDKVIPK